MTGWKLEKLHAEIKKTGKWAARILLVGFVDDCDLPALYSDALCFVYLSRYEGFGLPPLEAMACGTPVICSDCSSLPEVVGNAGILFSPDDHAGVANAIAKLESSSAMRADYIRGGLVRAAMFSWDQCCELVVSTLRETIKQRRSV
jgi:glycosyltransferase involved in cell wall biosynthesis